MRLGLAAILAVLLAAAVAPALSSPRAAVVYSSFRYGGYWYKDEQKPLIEELGWACDGYENTQIGVLADKLSEYAVIIFNTTYNYDNPQDLARYASQWRAYLAHGGCLVVTDANYEPMFRWLQAVEPGLRWTCRSELNPTAHDEAGWVARDHPLMKDVVPPRVPWTQPFSWSPALTPLVMDRGRRPVVAYLEIGEGLVVVSSVYRQEGWPSAAFLANLVTWARDPARLDALSRRRDAMLVREQEQAELALPRLGRAPRVDGTATEAEWQGAAVIPNLVDANGADASERTICRLARDDSNLYIVFDCFDSDISHVVADLTDRDAPVWTDDSVEVHIRPSGRGTYRFAVNAAGAQYDERAGDPGWDGYWVAKVGTKAGGWCVEMRIPIGTMLTTAGDTSSTRWLADFRRIRQARSGGPAALSAWSPDSDGSDTPRRFGWLTGTGVDLRPCSADPELQARPPERWFVGGNTVKVTVTPSGRGRGAGALACVDALSGREVARAQPVVVRPGKPISVAANVPLVSDGRYFLQFVLRDAENPDRVLAASRVLQATPEPLLKANLISPTFRNCIQSRDPERRVALEGSVGDTAAGDLRLRASITPSERTTPVWQEVRRVAPRSSFAFSASMADAAPGVYLVRLDLEDEDHRLLAQRQYDVRVLAPAATEVTFDAKRACYINGKPFFPIGLYHVSEPVVDIVNRRAQEIGLPTISVESMLRDVKEHRFNCVVRGWGMPSDGYLAQARDLGLWVMPEVGAPDEAALEDMVDTANRYGNVLMWYGIDEPAGERLQNAIAAHERYARLDPHRPVSAACNSPGFFGGAAQAYDVIMMDPYFIRTAPLSEIADWVKGGIEAGEGKKAVWVVPQAFGLDHNWAEPTPEELRCQAYMSLVHGATGLVWYAYFTTETYSNPKGRNQWFIPDSPLWPAFGELNAEVQELSPVLLIGESGGPVKCDQDVIHTGIWEHEGKRTLIAVNPSDKPVTCVLSGLTGKSAQVLFEDRAVAVDHGGIRDAFEPLEAHVYRF